MANLKPGWRRVKFGQLAECVNDRVDDPSKAGVDRYVGLEHLDPASLTIRRWGTPDEVESTKLRFRPGDIIFGKRRAYQRKLAVADFDGICSAHAMVLRAKSDAVLPEFLPFLMQSDLFMERAVAISVGSLSPTINWKTLAEEEFALPPMEEQRRIATLLTASVATLDLYQAVETRGGLAIQSLIDDHANDALQHFTDVRQLVENGVIEPPQDGNHGARHPKASDYTDSGVPFLMASDIRSGKVDLTGCKFISCAVADDLRPAFRAMTGDVLLTHKGTVGEVALLSALRAPYAMLTPQVTYYRVIDRQRLLPEYLCIALQTAAVRQQLWSLGRQSTRAFVSITTQLRLRLPIVPLSEQRVLVDSVFRLSCSLDAVRLRRSDCRNLIQSAMAWRT